MINMKRIENEYGNVKTIIFTKELYYQKKSNELGLEWTTDYPYIYIYIIIIKIVQMNMKHHLYLDFMIMLLLNTIPPFIVI